MNLNTKPSPKSYTVYWAKHAHFSKVKTEGYVGITSNSLDDRKKSHFKEARSSNRPNGHFHNVLKKYDNLIIWEILHENLSEKEALDKEAEYRPSVNIGWNSDRGGVKAISAEWYANEKNKEEHRLRTSAATKARIAEKDTSESRSERAKAVWENDGYRESREGLVSGDKNPQFGKFGEDHPAAGHKKTEAGRQAISKANKGKVVSEETKQKMSATRIAMFAPQKAERLAKLDKQRKQRKRQRAQDKIDGKFKGEAARPSKISDKQRAEICKRRMAGETYRTIAEKYPIKLTGVRAVCKDWGPNNGYPFEAKIGKSDRKKVVSPETKTAICKEYSEGISVTSLAADYNLSFQMIYTYLAEWGPNHNIPYKKQRSDQ
jgi:uncharacterized protein (DUF433 family)